MQGEVRIVLVDDHAVVRAGYRRFLEQEPGDSVIGEAASGEEAYALLQRIAPDIVLLDLSMPGLGGLSSLRRFKLRWPLLPILVFSMHDTVAFATQALRAGANGYVTKGSDPQLMVDAVRSVLDGEMALSPDVRQRLERVAADIHASPTLGLSVREFAIFRMIAGGKNHEDIAQLLNLSIKTVANNHSTIRQKLGVTTDIELLDVALECGVVEGFPSQLKHSGK
ncbi:MAG TPA: response regulator transcription factor [Steroidobacteraceae bacterium]|nr:response regulator transcription factor [Steroidobacteraceae bacterium]